VESTDLITKVVRGGSELRAEELFCYTAYDAFATVCSSRGGLAFLTSFISAFPARRFR
jgi:hypothetical protein